MRGGLHVWIPTNRAYGSGRNWGKPKGMDGLNEIISQNRTNKYKAASIERENVTHCARFVRTAMNRDGYPPMTEEDRQPACVYVTIYEPNDRRDVPNVLGGVLKYVLDSLTARNKRGAAAIWDDSSKWMPRMQSQIRIDPTHVGVEVTVIPLEGEL